MAEIPDRGADDHVTARDQRLEEIVAEFIVRQGEADSPTVEDYLGKYPTFAEDLAFLLSDDTGPSSGPHANAGLPRLAGTPREIGPYQLLDRVAVGGGGTVYRARHKENRHVVALKVIDGFAIGDAPDVERFHREARVLRSLDLVNVVPIEATGTDNDRHYIAMKWIEGTTLAGLIEDLRNPVEERARRLRPMQERARLVARIARTFEAVHSHGILHRDIKPSNILVDRLGEPMLIDFGIARAPDLELTLPSDGPLGTPRYLAPETLSQGRGGVTVRTDVYGLGLCLYELATGTRAFVQRTKEDLFSQIMRSGPLEPTRVARDVPRDLAAIIMRATAIAPERRYGSMAAFAEDLERFAGGEAPDPVTRRRAAPWRRFCARHPVALSGAVVAVASAAALLVFLSSRAQREAYLESLAARLDPWFLAPPEVGPLDDPELDVVAAELAREGRDRQDFRFRAAWIPFLSGHYEKALVYLGPARGDESGAIALFRAWLDMRFKWDARGDIIPGAITGLQLDVTDIEVMGDWSDAADGLRRRLKVPPPLDIRRFMLEWDGIADADATFFFVRALLRYMSIENEFPEEATDELFDPVLDDVRRVLATDPRHPWSRYVLGSLLVRWGRIDEALPVLEGLLRDRPTVPEVAYLLALAQVAKGGDADAASRSFAQASEAMTHRRSRRSSVPGGSLFEDQMERKLHGAWAVHEISRGRGKKEGREVLEVWRQRLGKKPDAHWHDRLFPLLLEARILSREGSSEEAAACLERAETVQPGLALPVRERARLLEAQGEERQADRAWRKAANLQAYPQQKPQGIEDWLAMAWFGVRPYARPGPAFTTGHKRAPPKKR